MKKKISMMEVTAIEVEVRMCCFESWGRMEVEEVSPMPETWKRPPMSVLLVEAEVRARAITSAAGAGPGDIVKDVWEGNYDVDIDCGGDVGGGFIAFELLLLLLRTEEPVSSLC